MRIVITKDGKKEISKLSKVINIFSKQNNKSLKRTHSSILISNYSFKPKTNNKNKIYYSNISSLNNNLSFNPTIKHIILHPLKLHLSKKQKLLYDISESKNYKIIKQSNDYISTLNHKNTFTFKSNYSLGEIVNKKIFKKLKNEIETKEKDSLVDKLVDHTSFRKEDKFKFMYDEIEDVKKKEINVENYNLIYYLLNKNFISRKYLKNLSEYNNSRINRLNKICKVFDVQKNEEKNINFILKQKIEAKKVNDDFNIFNKFNKIKNNIEFAQQKLNNFKPINRKIIYNNIHNKFVSKFWNNKKINKKRNYSQIGSIDYNPIKMFLEKCDKNRINILKK